MDGETWILEESFNSASGYDMMKKILSMKNRPTAVFAASDAIAIGAMRALKKHGYRIPEDVSIIGFDDIYISGYMEPALTTVHIPRHYMGRLAVKRLISVIEGGEHYAINIQINGYLKVRNSIAPLSGEMLAKMKDGKGLKKAEK